MESRGGFPGRSLTEFFFLKKEEIKIHTRTHKLAARIFWITRTSPPQVKTPTEISQRKKEEEEGKNKTQRHGGIYVSARQVSYFMIVNEPLREGAVGRCGGSLRK